MKTFKMRGFVVLPALEIATVAVIAALGLWPAPAAAINKCTAPDGKVTFQDTACVGRGEVFEVRPPVVVVPAPTPAAGADPNASTVPSAIVSSPAAPKAARKEGIFGETWQRRTYLENRGVPDAQEAVHQHRKACEKKLAQLRADQRNQGRPSNLTDAAFLQSLVAQMRAEISVCDMRARELLSEQHSLETELQRLQSGR